MNTPYYELDTETHTWLEAALFLAAGVADLQRQEKDREEIYSILAALAERFGMDTEPFVDEPALVVPMPQPSSPRFRVIVNEAAEDNAPAND